MSLDYSTLALDKVINSALEEYAKQLFPLSVFSNVFSDAAIEMGKSIVVPYYKQVTAAANTYVKATGYDVPGSYVVEARQLAIDSRKFQILDVYSDELARFPYIDLERIGKLMAQALARTVFADILSVVTAANFGVTTPLVSSAAAFDVDDITTLWLEAEEHSWPAEGRSIVIPTTYYAKLFPFEDKVNESGSSSSRRQAVIPNIRGFDIFASDVVPDNGENLVGFACNRSALMTGFAPIPAQPFLQQTDTRYRKATDGSTGIVLEYRRIANGLKDVVKEVIESNYGSAFGEKAALIRITSA